MEEILGHVENAWRIFKAWMSWKPLENCWNAFIKFEERYGDADSCWDVLEKFIDAHPSVKSYQRAAKFEEKHRDIERGWLFYERAIAELGDAAFDEQFFIQFT